MIEKKELTPVGSMTVQPQGGSQTLHLHSYNSCSFSSLQQCFSIKTLQQDYEASRKKHCFSAASV